MKKVEILLKEYFKIIKQFKDIKVLRTGNLMGDYGEYYVKENYEKYGFKLENSSRKSIDAIDKKGNTYQIKTRRINNEKDPIQFGIIRKFKENPFDFLICVVFVGNDTNPRVVAKLSYSQLKQESKNQHSKHQNGHILTVKLSYLRQYNFSL